MVVSVSESRMVIEVKPEQLLKAFESMVVTESGMVIEVKLEQDAKAL